MTVGATELAERIGVEGRDVLKESGSSSSKMSTVSGVDRIVGGSISAGSNVVGAVAGCRVGAKAGAGVGDEPGTTGTKRESGEGVVPGVPAGSGIVPGGSAARISSVASTNGSSAEIWEYPWETTPPQLNATNRIKL